MNAALDAYQDASTRERRDRLILEHLDYVRHVLGRVIADLPDGVDAENLEAAGMLGLVEAAGQFDPARGVPFVGFATRRIRGAIIDELRRNCPLPQHMLQKLNAVRGAYRTIGPDATPQQVADHLNLSVREVEECQEAARLTRMESWQEGLLDIEQMRARVGDPQQDIQQGELRRLLADGIQALPEQERLVLTLYYLEDLRLKEIGCVIRLSESRISRILAQAEERVRAFLERQLN